MMLVPLEKQVTSLALSKRLAEAIGDAETLFSWVEWTTVTGEKTLLVRQLDVYALRHRAEKRLAPAWTASELLEWLRPYYWQMTRGEEGYVVDLLYIDHLERVVGPTPAEALGELALKVKEGP